SFSHQLCHAANTSGGSSGSPVIDIHGRAVALNAGGSTQAASSFFLPLERVKRVLDLICKNKKVSRGTLQVEFAQKQYDECRRLGLPMDIEAEFRRKSPDLNGILSVKHIIPEGPADQVLATGDILIRINGNLVNHFVELEEILDSLSPENTGVISYITILIWRDKRFVEVKVAVQSLHDISPSKYVEVGGSIVHALSYQMARSYLHPCCGVFVADSGHMLGVAGIPSHAILTSIAHKKVRTLDDFIAVISKIPVGQKVPVRYYILTKKRVEIVKIVIVESLWGRFRVAERDDTSGLWTYTNLSYAFEEISPTKSIAKFVNIPQQNIHSIIASKITPSLCVVEFHAPFGVDGVNSKWADGVGIILDAKAGIVLVDRSTIPTGLGKLFLTFANNIIVPGQILYLHPYHNFAFVKYDVSFLTLSEEGGLPVTAVEFSNLPGLSSGDNCYLVTLSCITHIPKVQSVTVKGRGYFLFNDTTPPKFRIMNWDDAITLNKDVSGEAGVIVDDQGRVRAAWLETPDGHVFLGLTMESGSHVRKIIDHLKRQCAKLETDFNFDGPDLARDCKLRNVDAEFGEIYLWKSRELGLSESWIQKISNARSDIIQKSIEMYSKSSNNSTQHDICDLEDKYTILMVRRVPATRSYITLSDCDFSDDEDFETNEQNPKFKIGGFVEGDLVLALDGVPITHMAQFSSLEFNSSPSKEIVHEIVVLRNAKYLLLKIPSVVLTGTPRIDVVQWAGAVLQFPHRTLWFHCKTMPAGVYVSLLYSGSPAQRDGISACWFIVDVDGKKTPTLDAFLEAVEGPQWAEHIPKINPLTRQGWTEMRDENSESKKNASEFNRSARRISSVSQLERDKIAPLQEIKNGKLSDRPDGGEGNDTISADEFSGSKKREISYEGGVEEVGIEAPKVIDDGNMVVEPDDIVDSDEGEDILDIEQEPNKATVTRSFCIRMMSGEQVSKVVTVDVCLASKNYFPTWRCTVDETNK
ncbi:serine protease, partial [Nowakowskiella sp. JEL0078]